MGKSLIVAVALEWMFVLILAALVMGIYPIVNRTWSKLILFLLFHFIFLIGKNVFIVLVCILVGFALLTLLLTVAHYKDSFICCRIWWTINLIIIGLQFIQVIYTCSVVETIAGEGMMGTTVKWIIGLYIFLTLCRIGTIVFVMREADLFGTTGVTNTGVQYVLNAGLVEQNGQPNEISFININDGVSKEKQLS